MLYSTIQQTYGNPSSTDVYFKTMGENLPQLLSSYKTRSMYTSRALFFVYTLSVIGLLVLYIIKYKTMKYIH